MVLLQIFGVPGGIELLVILLIFLLLFGIPLLLVAGGGYLWFRSREDTAEQIAELQAEIAALRAELGHADNPSEDVGAQIDARRDDLGSDEDE